MTGGEVVPCHQCGGYKVKVRSRLWLTLRRRGKVTLLITLLTVTLVVAVRFRRCCSTHRASHQRATKLHYDRHLPLIFIGGVPGSGSSLLRLQLNGHPEIRCRSETRIIPRVVRMYSHWVTDRKEHTRLEEAGVTSEVLQSAVAALLLEVLVLSGDVAPRLCSQDPLLVHHAVYLSQLFPYSRFLWVVRDGRALVHTLISRQLQAREWSYKSVDEDTRDNLGNLTSVMMEQWNNATQSMLEQCRSVAGGRCRAVHYEQLVLRPRTVLRHILQFLNVTWDEAVYSSDAILKSRTSQTEMEAGAPLDQNFLNSWQEEFPAAVLRDISRIAPTLAHIGYDSTNVPIDYLRLNPSHPKNLFINVDES